MAYPLLCSLSKSKTSFQRTLSSIKKEKIDFVLFEIYLLLSLPVDFSNMGGGLSLIATSNFVIQVFYSSEVPLLPFLQLCLFLLVPKFF